MGNYSDAQRGQMAGDAFCGPDRSFPVLDAEDAHKALRALGRAAAGDRAAIHACVLRKAHTHGWDLGTAQMSATVPFGTTSADQADAEWVELSGKVFECGAYPDRAFALTEADADEEITAFRPVPLEVEHFFSREQPSIFDGKLGQLVALWREGSTLLGRVRVPRFVAQCWAENGNKISAVWDIPTKRLVRAGLVLDPYITDAQLSAQFAAFAGSRHNAADQAQLDAAHTLLVNAGAQCPGTHTAGGMARYAKETPRMSWKDRVLAALSGAPEDYDPAAETEPPAPSAPSAEFSVRAAALATQERDLAQQRAAFARQQYLTQAETAVDRLITDRRVQPAEDQPNADGQRTLVAVFAQALADDATGTALFGQAGGSRYAALTAVYAAREPLAAFGGEQLPVVTLPTGPATPDATDLAARRAALLARTPLGQRALKLQKES